MYVNTNKQAPAAGNDDRREPLVVLTPRQSVWLARGLWLGERWLALAARGRAFARRAHPRPGRVRARPAR